jgi:integrase
VSRAGSITKEHNRTWKLVVDIAPAGAPRQQVRRRGFATRRAAQEALDEIKSAVRRGEWVAPDRIGFGDYLTRWLAGLPTAGKRDTTVDSYRRTLRYVMTRPIAHIPLQGLTALELDALYSELATEGRRNGSGLSLRTVRYVHSIIGKALSDAERKGLVTRNVARRASPPRTSATRAPEMAVWTPDELRVFLDRTADHHHGALLRLGGMTGLRRSELCGLRWSDVDLDGLVLRVRRRITTVDHKPVEGDVKSARSRRTVDLDAETVRVLRTHRRVQLEQRMSIGRHYRDSDLVFAMPDGRGWNPDVITRAFDRLVKASPLPRIRLHDLRVRHEAPCIRVG